jgi:hypothetical protein
MRFAAAPVERMRAMVEIILTKDAILARLRELRDKLPNEDDQFDFDAYIEHLQAVIESEK